MDNEVEKTQVNNETEDKIIIEDNNTIEDNTAIEGNTAIEDSTVIEEKIVTYDRVKATRLKLIDKAYDGRLRFSLLAALIGMILGMIPVVLCAYWFGSVFYPFFIATPLLIYVFNLLLKGYGDFRSLFVNAVFSLAGAYISILFGHMLIIISYFGFSLISLPASFYSLYGRSGFIPKSASAYIYPLLFTALGITVIWELLRFSLNEQAVENEDDAAKFTETTGEI